MERAPSPSKKSEGDPAFIFLFDVNEYTFSLSDYTFTAILCKTIKSPRWYDFQVRIIDRSTNEINKLSDLSVNYKQEKRGRKIVGLVF